MIKNHLFIISAEGCAPRKKDAERQACLDACRKLDAHGLFAGMKGGGGGQGRRMMQFEGDEEQNTGLRRSNKMVK